MNQPNANYLSARIFSLVLSGFLLLTSLAASAAIEVHQFANDTERERYQSLIDEMRCPKCQNQNLSGSDSPIAEDLRREIYHQIKAGKADKEIVDYMVARYGEFILYKPLMSAKNLFLWVSPVILLLIGGLVLALVVRKRRQAAASALSAAQQTRLDELLNSSQGNPSGDSEPDRRP